MEFFSKCTAETNTDGVSVGVNGGMSRKRKVDDMGLIVPLGFLSPLPPAAPPGLPEPRPQLPQPEVQAVSRPSKVNGDVSVQAGQSCKQFWKAGDYEGASRVDWDSSSAGMDHVRVHPKFLHSNATSHKWALGAFAELLDNSLDEVCNGATYVNVDMLVNKKDGTRVQQNEVRWRGGEWSSTHQRTAPVSQPRRCSSSMFVMLQNSGPCIFHPGCSCNAASSALISIIEHFENQRYQIFLPFICLVR